ncbi:YopX family protein [Streptococcus danieliae]|uniref:YopX family protein n=1 Tax=Streptococcus danieliae TaxID=747656 RepID=UPI0021C5F2CE|nr:YopX family protein [Streptococcus danieliae]MCU0082464.1 YopX family protein [Streptococcus danieliae]
MIPKFRAWFNAKMYNEPLIHDGKVYLDWQDFEDGRTYKDIILMQSTGLIDSQGVEVFEGDVLYYPENPEGEKYGIVVWQKESLAFVLETAFDYLPYNLWLVGEVVGNIYENPELLEEVE